MKLRFRCFWVLKVQNHWHIDTNFYHLGYDTGKQGGTDANTMIFVIVNKTVARPDFEPYWLIRCKNITTDGLSKSNLLCNFHIPEESSNCSMYSYGLHQRSKIDRCDHWRWYKINVFSETVKYFPVVKTNPLCYNAFLVHITNESGSALLLNFTFNPWWPKKSERKIAVRHTASIK